MNKNLKQDYFLWRRFKEGDDEAFFEVYDQYVDILYRFGSQYLKDQDLIKDCIHDLFLDLYKYRKKLSDTDNIRFYLFCVLRHKIQREQVKNKAIAYIDEIQLLQDDSVSSHEDDLVASETEKEKLKLLQEALKTLSNKQCETISLKFRYNLSYPEIAKILNISVESVRTSIYRALKELRRCLKEKGQSVQLLYFLSGPSRLISPHGS